LRTETALDLGQALPRDREATFSVKPAPRGYWTECRPPSDLSDGLLSEMASLYRLCYEGTADAVFESDTREKKEVLLLWEGKRLVGFTTFTWYDLRHGGAERRIVFSGDTVIHPGHWGQPRLSFDWIRRMGRLKRSDPDRPLFWFLIVKGHRTFRYLPAFAKSFFPHWSSASGDLEKWAQFLAAQRFGDLYNPASGLIEFPESRGHLKEAYAAPSAREIQLEAVRFFMEKNPGFRRGHELVCLCELSADNLKPLARRLFEEGRRESLATA
jgi:hypothetical protein